MLYFILTDHIEGRHFDGPFKTEIEAETAYLRYPEVSMSDSRVALVSVIDINPKWDGAS